MRLKADLVLLLVAVLWGSAFAALRAAGLVGSVFFFNAARFLVAGIILLPFAVRTPVTWTQVWWACAAGMVLFIASALQQAGLRTTTAGNAGFLTSLYVVFVPLVMFFGWNDRPHIHSVVAVVLAAMGAYLLSTGGRFHIQVGDLLELGGATFWALHVVLLGKVAYRYNAISFSAGQLLVGSALNWVASALVEPPMAVLPPILVTAILYTSVVSLGLGYTLQIWGQKNTHPTDAALILSLEAVFAALAGAITLGERLAQIQVLGCAIIVFAVLLSQLKSWGRIRSLRPSRTG
jgi:drug/metabolite transporter (DMT)-like permease